MKVLKFGGSSVASADRIKHIHSIIKPRIDNGESLTIVFSAFGGVTDQLIKIVEDAAYGKETYLDALTQCISRHEECIKQLFPESSQSEANSQINQLFEKLKNILKGVYLLKEVSDRSYDYVMSFGERLSNTIIALYFDKNGIPADFVDARDLLVTNSEFRSASVKKDISFQNIINHFDSKTGRTQIVTGFVASDTSGRTTTLGRGGSDYTASLFAAALNAEVLEIWTDVDGVLTANPKVVDKAFSIPTLSYNEAMELSHFGAKVIYPPTIQPVLEKEIDLYIRNTFNPEYDGTAIHNRPQGDKNIGSIKGLTSLSGISLVTISGSGMHGVPGTAARIFNTLAANKINIILITQASSEHSICLAILESKAQLAKEVLSAEFQVELDKKKLEEITVEDDICVLAVVGESMKEQPGIAGKIFSALGRNGVNIEAIAQGSSELNISFAIKSKDEKKALNLIHDSFFKNTTKTLNLFIVGTGLIGSTLLSQMSEFRETLLKHKGVELKLIGLSNSKKMAFSDEGINFTNWKSALEESSSVADPKGYVENMIQLNKANSIFIDNTASGVFPDFYKQILSHSISISTPNKVASSGTYESYLDLKQTAISRNTKFLFETNVGAGLPILSTISTLRNSGDKITKIEAVLSGSISYIFNKYNPEMKFHDIVKEAQSLGFTEPDPRDDLSGLDVMRKITILARESGYEIDKEDVKLSPILPKACLEASSVEDFFSELLNHEGHFNSLVKEAQNDGKRLRFIASFENGAAELGLKLVDESSPFYNLSESDNMVSFNTSRYASSPLVITGPGAGGDVTAAGVFAEIIQISNEVFSF